MLESIKKSFTNLLVSEKGKKINVKYIGELDGIRSLAMFLIVFFHFWQQTWIQNVYETPFLKFIGIEKINTGSIFKTGYEFVDLMIFLSAFCLFLPYARAMVFGEQEQVDSVKTFYKKRAARILPSYYFCVLLLFIINIVQHNYNNTTDMWKDFISHLTFTQMFDSYPYFSTLLNVVLWTMCIEVMFYVIFPLLAKCFRKYPYITYCVMVAISQIYIHYYVIPGKDLRFFVNSFPSFFGVFANGMMAALIFVSISKRMRRGDYSEALFTVLSIASLLTIYKMLIGDLALISDYDVTNQWQLEQRYLISFVFAVFVISTALSKRWYRTIFSNPLTKFIAGISMNIYIWHQWLAVWIKYDLKVPYWTGDKSPNVLGDVKWQYDYQMIIILSSIIVAILVTYLIEKPCAKFILKKKFNNSYIKNIISVLINYSVCFFFLNQLLATCIKNEISITIWPFGDKIILGDINSYFVCINIIFVLSAIITAFIMYIKHSGCLLKMKKMF